MDFGAVRSSEKSSVPDVVHVSLARPALVALLALILGHYAARGVPIEPWMWLLVIAVAGIAMATFRVSTWAFVLSFCLMVAGTGAWQKGRVLAADRHAAALATMVADGGSPLGEIRGRLSRMPAQSASHWTLTLAAGGVVQSRGLSTVIPAPMVIRIRGDAELDRSLRPLIPGDGVTAMGEVLELPRSGDGSEPWGWYSDRGAVLLMQARDIRPEPQEHHLFSPGNWARLSWNAGNKAEAAIFHALPRREAGLLAAMSLGRTGHLDTTQRVSFRRAGLMHLFAVSGLHTSLVGLMVIGALRLFGVGPVWRFLLLFAFLFFFATLVGWKASVLRAALLLLLFDARELIRRPVDSLNALAAVGLGLLLVSPPALAQVDFQMTFLCMVAIVLVGPWMNELRKSMGQRLGWSWMAEAVIGATQLFLLSVSIQLMLAPVLAERFGEISLVAPISNVLLLPLAALCIKAVFLSLAFSLAFPWGADWLIGLLEWPLWLLAWAAGMLGGGRVSALSSPPWPFLVVIVFYTLVWFAEWNRHHHFSQPRRPLLKFLPQGLALVLLLLWLPIVAIFPAPFRVWVLDVGQGDAILVRSPDGRFGLIDGGPPGSAWLLPEMLRSRGVSELDWVVATHADADHIAGLPAVMRELTVHKLIVGGSMAGTRLFEELERTVAELGQPVATVTRGARLPLGRELVFDVLHPTLEFATGDMSRNDASIVLRVNYGGTVLLLTGDAESAAERDISDAFGGELRATIAMAAHHGSRGSTTPGFLAHVMPELAIISCGRNNSYGHPHPEVIERLESVGSIVARTDQDGTISVSIHRDGKWRWSATRR